MDQSIAPPLPVSTDPQSPNNHRQSILGSFLRVRPRGGSQSQQQPPNLNLNTQYDNLNGGEEHSANSQSMNMFNQPPSPNLGNNNNNSNGHRRRPAANALQASVSNGLSVIPGTSGVGVHGFSQILRRRRSANGALNTAAPPQSASSTAAPVDSASMPTWTSRPGQLAVGPTHRIRLVPHLDSNRSLHFDPISRDVRESDLPLRIGRFTDRSGAGAAALNAQNSNKLAFKSKVVSRAHAEVWCEQGGKFFIKDTKSSSGTFLNHMRLSQPNTDSKSFPLKDGDVLQLGVDYQGGAEEIYKCVKMRVELGREWQSQANAFNTAAMKQLKALSAEPSSGKKIALSKSGISDCCICLFGVSVNQSLFIAPCSHVFHYKCIRPLLMQHHPGFSCPLCRTFADLEDDVEVEVEDMDDIDDNATGTGGSGAEGAGSTSPEPMDADAAAINVSAMLNAANEVAAQVNAGAETEVERDLPSRNYRRRDGAATLRMGQLPSPMRGQMEGLPEHAEESLPAMSDSEDCGEVVALPPLPISGSAPMSAALGIPGAGGSSSHRSGFDIVRPMSVPAPYVPRAVVSDDGSDDGADFDMIVGLDGDASGSSGEGIGAGGKRKR